MDSTKLEQKLWQAARSRAPEDRVPYAFEKRVLARLRSGPAPEAPSFWAAALMRASVPCLAVALLLSVWSFTLAAPAAPDFAQQLENTVLAAADQETTLEIIW